MKEFFSTIFTIVPLLMVFSGFVTGEEVMAQEIEVMSHAFDQGGMIPSDFTCDGADMSPPIEWSGIPQNAQSLALIANDPDAPGGDWVHWVIYDLPPNLPGLPPGVSAVETLPMGGVQGRTDFGRIGYGGPCPPSGSHRYFFKVYVLDQMLGLKPGATKKELLKAMKGHVLAEGQLMGKYQRS